MKKNAFTLVELIAVIVLLCIIVLISFPALTNVIKGGEEKNKEEALNTIYMAAENYLMANYEDYIINNTGDTAYVYITDLINNNYLNADTVNPNNDLSFSSKDVVKITRNEDGTFKYELEYVKTLIEILLERYNEDNTTGLVKDSTNQNLYYYTGTEEQVSNNYLWYGGHQWRVLEFDTSENYVTLISQQPLTTIQPTKKEWTTKEAYESSYVNNWLNNYFWNSLDNSIKNDILSTTFNVGIYTNVDEITTEQNVGLLDNNQYVKAGGQNSFLDIKDNWWLGNLHSTWYICYIDSSGNVNKGDSGVSTNIRPVVKIHDLNIISGDGSLISSYRSINNSLDTSSVQVGEYINVPYNGSDSSCGDDQLCTFRVVSKDDDSIKVIMNGLLPQKSIYGSNSIITTSHEIYNVLNNFANNISDNYIYTGNKSFYIGDYSYEFINGKNYEDVYNEILQASIGLPTIGEMFSSNDIDLSMSITKNFVDVNTIENPTVSDYYWTMNRYNSSSVRLVYGSDDIFGNPSDSYGVRPVIYLKNNLNFTGGNGTAQNPYTLN